MMALLFAANLNKGVLKILLIHIKR